MDNNNRESMCLARRASLSTPEDSIIVEGRFDWLAMERFGAKLLLARFDTVESLLWTTECCCS